MPWIDDERSARLEVPRVAGHDVKTVPKRCRRQKAVNARNDDPGLLGTGRDFALEPSRLDVDSKDSVGILVFHPSEPRTEQGLLSTGGKESDALGDLAHGENAQIKVRGGDVRHGGFHRRISIVLPKLGENASVEQ